jgi:hypothetical protein
MNGSPPIPESPKQVGNHTPSARDKGVCVGATITIAMLLCTWFGLADGVKDPNPFQVVMLILNAPAIIFTLGGAKGRTGDYYILGFLIVVQWAMIGSIVGYLVTRLAQRREQQMKGSPGGVATSGQR